MIVATAGHIDHGKTTLVRALTGVDTDRLPEEKRRGISIDLGFAYRRLADGELIGFVDVPGHERFVRNMVAGVCGIDFALLVVAADDGVMPQTREHLHILDILGVTRGAVVITKTDRVEMARVEAVEREIRVALGARALAGAPVLHASAVSGEGIAELTALLESKAAGLPQVQVAERQFRFAIDRAFSVSGSGTVVTGTIFDGEVRVGDALRISPLGAEVRVKRIRLHDTNAEHAFRGQRCALNLHGVDAAAVARGDWVVAPLAYRPTACFSAEVAVLADESRHLRHWAPVHVHLGTATMPGRVALAAGGAIAPGAQAYAQIVLDKPIGAWHGDRFILRDAAGERTLGGGMVLDPFPQARRRKQSLAPARLDALKYEAPGKALVALAKLEPGWVDVDWFAAAFNLSLPMREKSVAEADLTCIGKSAPIALSPMAAEQITERVHAHLRRFHRDNPYLAGQEAALLAAESAPTLPSDAFDSLLRLLAQQERLRIEGSKVCLPAHRPGASREDKRLWERVGPKLLRAGFNVPTSREMAERLALDAQVLRSFMQRKSAAGALVKTGDDRYYPRATMARLAALARELAQASPEGRFTAAQFRDATGFNRGLAIDILEALDRLGITRREGDRRQVCLDHEPLLGSGTPKPVRNPANWRRHHRFASQPST